MVDIVTRLGKGSPLTNAEVDANFTNLAEVSGVTGEPMGHEDRTTSTISFNASTRTFTIAPVASSFTVWCKGKKVVVSTAQTVTIPNTTGMYSIYYDANGVLSAKSGYFTFSLEAPTAYVYWNAATGTAPYFGDERHGVVLDWQTHEYLHRTRGAALASGFSASGYVLGGNGSSNSHAQITLEGGTFFDEDMKIIVTATNTPTAGTWEQDLLSPARIPVLYLSGTGWVIDAPTDYPLKQGTSRPQYNAYSGGVWSTADVANNKYATSWILATNNLTYPVIAIIGQAENDLQSAAEAVDFTALQLPGFPSVEFRPLYKLIFQCADSCTNAVHASLVSITDIRSIAAAGTAASIVTDHGNLSGLSDDDHPQYIHVDTLRTVSAAVKASFLPSQTSNAGKFLQTDGTATSWQALTSGNVTTALGFTPYNATNPSGYISGITSGMVTTALGFTPYNATNPSGYVTAAGARGAISVTGAGSYDSATGVINIVGGVTSFNTRTGAITLSSADVTTALGFTPYNNTNPSGYITGITSTMVTTALGFTPYNSSNPNGYISSITSANVTTALGFTPYNATNPSGYITSSALSGYLTSASAASTYLPLAGGTLTGAVTIDRSSGGAEAYVGLTVKNTVSSAGIKFQGPSRTYEIQSSSDGFLIYDRTAEAYRFTINSSGTLFQGNQANVILHAGNYSSYALPLSGGTLTGALTIATGGLSQFQLNSPNNTQSLWIRAGYTANGTATPLSSPTNVQFQSSGSSGGTFTFCTGNDVTLSITGSSVNSSVALQQSGNQVLHAGNYSSYALPLSGGTLTGPTYISTGGNYPLQLISTQRYMLQLRNSNNSVNSGYGWWFATDTNFNFAMHADGLGDVFTLTRSGALTLNGNTVLHAGNYNSYSPTLTGGNASGTWGISITGNAATVGGLSPVNFFNNMGTAHSTTTNFNSFGDFGFRYMQGNANGPGTGATQYYGMTLGLGGEYSSSQYATQFYWNRTSTGGNPYVSVRFLESGSWGSWAKIYAGYADSAGSATTASGLSNFVNQSGSRYDTDINSLLETGFYNTSGIPSNSPVSFGQIIVAKGIDTGLQIAGGYSNDQLYFRGWANSGSVMYSWRTLLHNGNYSSYALPLSGGTLSGDLQLGGNYLRFDQSGTRSWNMRATGGNLDLNSGDGVGSFRYNGGVILTSNSYGSYAVQHINGDSGAFNLNVSGQQSFVRFSTGVWVNPPFAGNYSHVLSFNAAADNRTFQIYLGDVPGTFYYRPCQAGTWHPWERVLSSNNYNSYSPTLTGGNASGTWGINVTGNAGSATTAAKSSATTVPASTAFTKWLFATNSTSGTQDWNHVSNTRPGVGEVLLLGNHANGPGGGNYYHPLNFEYSSIEGSGNVTQLAIAYGSPGNELYMRGSYSGSWNGWNRFLNSNNYSSYALPLSGGTLSGNLTMNGPGSSTSIIFGDATKQINVEGYWMMFKGHQNEGFRWQTSDGSTYTTRMQLTSSALTMNGNTVVHAGNVSSYALPIGGGTLTDATKIKAGHGNTRFQLHYNHDGADTTSGYAGYLTLWASEPGMSYAYTGIGGNININGNYYGRQTSGQSYGLYLRFETASGFSEFWSTTGAVGAAGGQGSRVAYIDAGGNGTFSGNVTAFSDERLKKDWAALPADFIARLATVKSGTYTRVDSGARQAGSSAQDWQVLLPEVVSASNDEAQTLTLAYGNAALVSAVELAKEVVDLRNRVAQLESLINKLIGD